MPRVTPEVELWQEIPLFPSYRVSSTGKVINADTGYPIAITKKANGLCMVGLMRGGTQQKRSLALLVATAFVERPSPSFDTPIHLDGNRSHNHCSNLMWRPLWMARKFMQQFDGNMDDREMPIEDMDTRIVYRNPLHASMEHGLLETEIRTAMATNTYVWPTHQKFREVY